MIGERRWFRDRIVLGENAGTIADRHGRDDDKTRMEEELSGVERVKNPSVHRTMPLLWEGVLRRRSRIRSPMTPDAIGLYRHLKHVDCIAKWPSRRMR